MKNNELYTGSVLSFTNISKFDKEYLEGGKKLLYS